ncbi:Uncharacterised protein [Mycobacteroides abscessus]|nr:Uncharacterised protein [Mycobacteroides abscessus]
MRRARPRPPSGRRASGSYQESKICRKIHCVQRTYSGSIVANVRRESCASPRRRSCRRMLAMFASVVTRGCCPVCTAYCSAGRPNAS